MVSRPLGSTARNPFHSSRLHPSLARGSSWSSRELGSSNKNRENSIMGFHFETFEIPKNSIIPKRKTLGAKLRDYSFCKWHASNLAGSVGGGGLAAAAPLPPTQPANRRQPFWKSMHRREQHAMTNLFQWSVGTTIRQWSTGAPCGLVSLFFDWLKMDAAEAKFSHPSI